MKSRNKLLVTAFIGNLFLGNGSNTFGAGKLDLAEQTNTKSNRSETRTVAANNKTHSQVYGIATYDALFKYVLSDDNVRPSFFKAFIPGLPIINSVRLDDHMNPIQKLQLLRNFLHLGDTTETVKRLSSDKTVYIGRKVKNGKKTVDEIDQEATAFLNKLLGHFEEIQTAFPEPRYNGTMDFVCELSTGEYTMVEMQVIPEDHWDRRALAYVGAFYGNQLMRGEHFKHIRQVIGINILGGGKNNLRHWSDTPSQYVRHYKVQEQLHTPARYMDGIELIQYSIMNAPSSTAATDQEQSDWITFFKEGHYMTEKEVKQKIKTPSVLEAFKRAKIKDLPAKVLANYESEDKEYDRYSQFTADQIQKGKTEGEKAKAIEIARNLKSMNLTIEQIKTATGLCEEEIRAIE